MAAHALRYCKQHGRRQRLAAAVSEGDGATLQPREALALKHIDASPRRERRIAGRVRGTRSAFNDSELVELDDDDIFFNYLTRYAEAVRLPVEPWALDDRGAGPRSARRYGNSAHRVDQRRRDRRDHRRRRCGKDQAAQAQSLGLGMANCSAQCSARRRSPSRGGSTGRAVRTDEHQPRHQTPGLVRGVDGRISAGIARCTRSWACGGSASIRRS